MQNSVFIWKFFILFFFVNNSDEVDSKRRKRKTPAATTSNGSSWMEKKKKWSSYKRNTQKKNKICFFSKLIAISILFLFVNYYSTISVCLGILTHNEVSIIKSTDKNAIHTTILLTALFVSNRIMFYIILSKIIVRGPPIAQCIKHDCVGLQMGLP